MKIAIVILACLATMVASTTHYKYNMDKTMVEKQKFFLDILYRVWDPLPTKEYMTWSETLPHEKSFFKKFDHDMEHLTEHYEFGKMLRKGEYFTIFNKYHLSEVKGLFKYLYYAKDWATFMHIACWARAHMNEGVFVYAMNMVVIHHPDYKDIVLPALDEIMPHMFYDGKFVLTANTFNFDVHAYEVKFEKLYMDTVKEHLKKPHGEHEKHKKWWHWFRSEWDDVTEMEFKLSKDHVIFSDHMEEYNKDPHWTEMFKDVKVYWMKHEYTDHFHLMNDEGHLTYLTEDFDWNMYWYYSHMRYPYWMDAKEFGFEHQHFGEFFLFNLQQILARYYLERQSHGMGMFDKFSWDHPVEHGYNPRLINHYFTYFASRPNNYDVCTHEESILHSMVTSFYDRISDVVDKGTYTTADGVIIDMKKPESIEWVGEWITGHHDIVDKYFFGNWMWISNILVSQNDWDHMYNEMHVSIPHVFLHFETMLRDPLFYEVYSQVVALYYKFKHHLKPYTYEELHFDGVTVLDFTSDKFVTYYDWVDSDVSALVDYHQVYKDGAYHWDNIFVGRRIRLNHEPFTMKFDIDSKTPVKAVIRTFMGPKYDEYGHEHSINTYNKMMWEMDSFHTDLVAGKNTIKRSSDDFYWTRNDHSSYFELYKSVMMTLENKMDFYVEYDSGKVCGFPDHLLLPKGWYNGMPMQVFVMVSPFDTTVKEHTIEEYKQHCGAWKWDKFSWGYPLDREIDEHVFFVPNMFFKDVMIYHKEHSDMNGIMEEHVDPKYHY